MKEKLYVLTFESYDDTNNNTDIYFYGGYEVMIFNDIQKLKNIIMDISRDMLTLKTKYNKIFLTSYSTKKSFNEIQNILKNYWLSDGFNEKTKRYENKIFIKNYIESLNKFKFESYDFIINGKFSYDLVMLFKDEILKNIDNEIDKIRKIIDLDVLNGLKIDIYDEIIQQFPFISNSDANEQIYDYISGILEDLAQNL